MALWFDRLKAGKLWASLGQVAEPTDSQADEGWKYVPDGIPSEQDFNARDQWTDRALYWLFQQAAGVMARGGIASPAEAGPNQLADALRNIMSGAPTLYGRGSHEYVAAANRVRHLVICTGPGGGATIANSTIKSGAAGGAGSTAIGLYNLTPGSRYPVVVGPGGLGGGRPRRAEAQGLEQGAVVASGLANRTEAMARRPRSQRGIRVKVHRVVVLRGVVGRGLRGRVPSETQVARRVVPGRRAAQGHSRLVGA